MIIRTADGWKKIEDIYGRGHFGCDLRDSDITTRYPFFATDFDRTRNLTTSLSGWAPIHTRVHPRKRYALRKFIQRQVRDHGVGDPTPTGWNGRYGDTYTVPEYV